MVATPMMADQDMPQSQITGKPRARGDRTLTSTLQQEHKEKLLVHSQHQARRQTWAGPEGVGQGSGHPLKNHKNIEFLSNTGPDSLKNHKTTKPAFNSGPLSARQRNAI